MEKPKLSLTPIPETRQLYHAKLGGKNVVIAYRNRNRAKAKDADVSVSFSESQIRHAKDLAKKLEAPGYVVCQITVTKKWHASFAVPIEDWSKFHTAKADFPVGPKMREEYFKDEAMCSAAGRYMGFRVEVAKAVKEEKAKPKAQLAAEIAEGLNTQHHPDSGPKVKRRAQIKAAAETRA